jgi:uncharacterized protein
MAGLLSNVIGFDDAPFERSDRGDVLLVGTICSRTRLDGVVSTKVRRDGANSTSRMIEIIQGTRYASHIRAVLLQGIAVAGFNVVDIHRLHRVLEIPVLVVARKSPGLARIQEALENTVPGAKRKWKLIQQAGPMEPLRQVFVQRAGLTLDEARDLLAVTTLHGNIPEPLRLAHLIAGGVTTGVSRGRA